MSLLLNRAKETTATTGTGTVTVSGAVTPYQTWAAAQPGTSTTRRYSYLIEDGLAWELGEGVFNEGAGTITRSLIASSTGALLNLSGTATIACVAKAADSPQVIEKKLGDGVTTSFVFSDIPQEFTDLKLVAFGRLTGAPGNLTVTFNGLTTAIYNYQRQYGLNTTNTADQGLAQTNLSQIITMAGNTNQASQSAHADMDIYGYSQSVFHKTGYTRNRWPQATTSLNGYDLHSSFLVGLTAAITSIEVTAPSAPLTGSYLRLIGVP